MLCSFLIACCAAISVMAQTEPEKIVVSDVDPKNHYVGDGSATQLYYHALLPPTTPTATIILMPGTWETTEHVLASTKELCDRARARSYAVIVPSINQRLAMTQDVVALMNSMFADAVQRYHLDTSTIVIGGFSMGGLFSLRYTELAHQRPGATAITPMAVICCDGPIDLLNIHAMFQRKHKKFPDNDEAVYGMHELESAAGGTPRKKRSAYVHFSAYTHDDPHGGNARFLRSTPVRIYADVDPNWWMDERGLDMYDMNALDQSAMILFLREHGNKRAEFINAFGKGMRIEGNRHPHSWSIVDAPGCVSWIDTLLAARMSDPIKERDRR
ncbi:MAG: hypothetical protein JSS89_00035 [Bacteroidetes bacterium]|nr:hypothetical protein [Bacteroidota bacterium]